MKKSKFLFLVVMVIIYCTSLCLLSSANENNVDDPQLADIESDSCTVLNVEHSSLLSSDSLIRTVNAMNSDIEDYYSIPLDNIKSTSNIAITTAFTYNRTLYFEESMKLLNAFKEDIQRYESIYGSDFQVIKETVTNSYNCHAYAWYGAPNNGSCWIDDPYEFINDPHCDRITNNVYDGSVQEGDIVFFYSGQEYTRGTSPNHVAVHSSIVDSIDYVDGMLMAMPLDGGEMFPVFEEDVVSMNMFGFTKELFDHLEARFPVFLDNHKDDINTCEFLIPTLVFDEIENNTARVEVLKTDAVWQGITYREDKDKVVTGIKELVLNGEYPEGLWN